MLIAHDLDGNRIDRVRLSPAKNTVLKDTAWINRAPYEGQGWPYHYALLYLLGDPGLGCVLTITGQTVYARQKYAGSGIGNSAKIKENMLAGRA